MGVAHAVTLHIKSFTSSRKLLIAFLTVTAAPQMPVDDYAWRRKKHSASSGTLSQERSNKESSGIKGAEYSNLPTKMILSAFTSNCIRLRPLPIGLGVE